MSKDARYTKMLQSKRWRELRGLKLAANMLCERCLALGYERSAVVVHHRVPVESGRTLREMEDLCFRWSNLVALCVPCHIEVHKEEKSHTRKGHKEREEQRLNRWIEEHNKKYGHKDTE